MKKIYLVASCMLVGGVAFGQRTAPTAPVYDFAVTPHAQVKGDVSFNDPATAAALQKGGAIWTEDFANGFNSTNGTWTQGGIDQIWKHSMYTSSGEWSTGTPAYAGTTAANGFMLFDADSVNFLVTPNYVDKAGELISPSIDLSSEAAVSLTFEQNMRWCCTQLVATVGVSNDGGSTWTDYDVVNGLAANAGSANPELVNINISAVAANQANVMIRFSWNAVSHYYWIVDDINLVAPAGDDVTLTSVQYDNDIEYSIFPQNQTSAMDFWGYVDNQGANAQTNVTMGVSVDGTSGGNVHTATGVLANLASTAIDSINGTPTFTPSAIDEYTISYGVTMDATDINPADNTLSQVFWVSDTVYARDNNSPGGGLWNQDDGAGNTNSFEMGPFYEIENNDYITSVTIYIGANTDVGAIVYGVVYMDDASGFLYMDQTNDHTVTAGDIGGSVTLALSNPIAVAPGEGYVACAGHYGGPDALYIATGGIAPAQTCFLLDGTDNTWYYVTSIPAVRMNLVPNVGLNEATAVDGIKLGQNYPNPVDGTSTISYEIAQSGNVVLEVYDFTGKKVMEVNEGSKVAGQHSIILDANNLSGGLYTYTLTVDDKRMTKTMMVK